MTMRAAPAPEGATVTAVLGPTNTGKTHYAIDRMIGRETGIIGLPLRLLAREVYDKIAALRGPQSVALITGEEKIQPRRARYFVCTVEAMPLGRGADFVAIDEIQMCADPERGHIFTDRLLHARGRYETLFLGSDAVRSRIASLVPEARFLSRDRFSTLTYAGAKKISRLKPRAAVVGFSVDNVYAIAELIRRQRGGAAVVMGALSPRTRNAQVDLYQQGDVDYLVATDAIGMGLNLDIDHVAFAGLAKFDGHRHRRLEPNELSQIAGRAGRYKKDGTFGVTGEAPMLEPEVAEAIENHRFKPIQRLMWRNSDLSFGSVPGLLASLDELPQSPDLAKAREASDQAALRLSWEDPEIRRAANRPDRVRLLWEVCQIPDFRKVANADHASLISKIYQFLLSDRGVIPSDWIAGQVARIDRVAGDIDTLSKRLAYIRTWTFVAHRGDWVEDAVHWQGETRAVEDRLSDALHDRLTQRFVDRRTSVLLRRLKQKERLVAEVNDKGDVTVEGEFLGRIEGFRFRVDETATTDELKTLRAASLAALQSEFARRADKLYLSPDGEIDVTEQGGLMWGTDAIGRLEKGDDPLSPNVQVFVDDAAGPEVAEKVARRLTHWVARKIKALFEPMLAMRDDEAVTGLARGVAFQLAEAMGVIPRREIADDIKALGQDERALLRKHGVRFGQHTIFMPLLLKPAPTRMRLLLWSLGQGFEEFPEAPPAGHVTIPAVEGVPEGYYAKAGYRLAGPRAVRIDMLERLADIIRPLDQRGGFEATAEMLSITGCTLDQLAEILQGLGFKAEKGERPKTPRPAKAEEAGKTDVTVAPADATPPAADAPPAPEADGAADGQPESETAPPEQDTPPTETAPEAAPEPEPAAEPDSAPTASETAEAQPQDAAPSTEPTEPEPVEATEQPDEGTKPAESDASEAAAEAASPEGEPETEVFYTFTLKPRRPQGDRRPRQGQGRGRGRQSDGAQAGPASEGEAKPDAGERGRGGKPRGKGRPKGEPGQQAGGPGRSKRQDGKRQGGQAAQSFQAKPKRPEKPVDPDSPFAILQQLKNK